MSGPMDKLQALDALEKEILNCLQSSGQAFAELGKEKPSNKQVDLHTNSFLKTLNHVELELTKHINYLTQVSTGQAHEGSSYASQKVLQMAWHRSEHARTKVMEFDRLKAQMGLAMQPRHYGLPQTPRAALQQPPTPSMPAPSPIQPHSNH